MDFLPDVINTARIVRGTGFMKRSSTRPSVCQSVCPIDQQQQRRAAGLLLSAVQPGDIDRQQRAPSSNCATARRSAANATSTDDTRCYLNVRSKLTRVSFLSTTRNGQLKSGKTEKKLKIWEHRLVSQCAIEAALREKVAKSDSNQFLAAGFYLVSFTSRTTPVKL